RHCPDTCGIETGWCGPDAPVVWSTTTSACRPCRCPVSDETGPWRNPPAAGAAPASGRRDSYPGFLQAIHWIPLQFTLHAQAVNDAPNTGLALGHHRPPVTGPAIVCIDTSRRPELAPFHRCRSRVMHTPRLRVDTLDFPPPCQLG